MAREAAGDLALNPCEVDAIDVEAVYPQMRAAYGVGELDIEPKQITRPPNAAFDDIADAEFATDLFHVNRLVFVSKRSVPGDHKAAGNLREIGGQVVGDAIGEIFQLRIIREIGKGQHDDRESRYLEPRRRLVLLFIDLADEADALADDRADQPLLLAGVADRAARGVDAARKGRFRDDPSPPDRSQEIVLADDPIAVSDQEYQEIKHLGLNGDQRGPALQLTPLRVESVMFEQKQQCNYSRRMFRPPAPGSS